jgi:hypothetical protein
MEPLHEPPPQSAFVLHCTHPNAALQSGVAPLQVVAVPGTHPPEALQVLAGTNVLPVHDAGAQSALTLHCTQPMEALQNGTAPLQLAGVPGTHLFAPLQVPGGVNVLPLHDAAAQSAATLHCTQPKDALQAGEGPLQVCGVATHAPEALQVPAGVNVLPLHDAPAQSVLTLHCTQPFVVLQNGVVPLQSLFVAHCTQPLVVQNGVAPMQVCGTALHAPEPLQKLLGVNVLPLQNGMAHTTVLAACSQPPLPSQLPVLPQGGLEVHAGGLAGKPFLMNAQVPSGMPVAIAVHAWHVPMHWVWQQICWPVGPMQTPFWHCEPAVQAAPSGRSVAPELLLAEVELVLVEALELVELVLVEALELVELVLVEALELVLVDELAFAPPVPVEVSLSKSPSAWMHAEVRAMAPTRTAAASAWSLIRTSPRRPRSRRPPPGRSTRPSRALRSAR